MSLSTKTLKVFKDNNSHLEFVSEVELFESYNLLELLNAHNIGINQSCGGHASCTTCRVLVNKGAEFLASRNEQEEERASERSFMHHERLACQVELPAGVTDFEIVIANPIEL